LNLVRLTKIPSTQLEQVSNFLRRSRRTAACFTISSGYWHHPVLVNLSGNYNFVNTIKDKGRHYPRFVSTVNVTLSQQSRDIFSQARLSRTSRGAAVD
jgi:hypothetical protein